MAVAESRERRAIGIVRVSRVGKRDQNGERFLSPDIQRDRIASACEQYGLRLIDTHDELDVSGGKALSKRPGLARAVAAVEAGAADAIVFAYRDRMDRSMDTASELCRRVDAAGATLIADGQVITHATHDGWRRATMESFFNEDQRRAIAAKMEGVHERAVAEGKTPFARVPLGYSRENGKLSPNPDEVPLARRVFEMRAEGKSVDAIKKWLDSEGVKRSHRGVQVMLANRIYLGEIHFGELSNLAAHEPIIDRDLWGRAQRMTVPRGPQPRSTRLLARLGIVRCGSCGNLMSTMKLPRQGDYPVYRCGSYNDCPRHMTISAELVESAVVERVRAVLADVEGRASAEARGQERREELAAAQSALDAAVRAFDGLGDVDSARERLAELRAAVDAAQARVDELGDAPAAVSVNAARDWDRLTRDEQRELIKATIKAATIAPGRGPERITVTAA